MTLRSATGPAFILSEMTPGFFRELSIQVEKDRQALDNIGDCITVDEWEAMDESLCVLEDLHLQICSLPTSFSEFPLTIAETDYLKEDDYLVGEFF